MSIPHGFRIVQLVADVRCSVFVDGAFVPLYSCLRALRENRAGHRTMTLTQARYDAGLHRLVPICDNTHSWQL